MKKFLIFAISLITLSSYAAEKDAFAGFYKGEVTGQKIPYPFGAESDIYAEVYRGPNQTYRVKFLQGIMGRAEEHAVVEGLKAAGNKIVLKDSEPGCEMRILGGEVTPEKINAKIKFKGKESEVALERMNYVSPTMGKRAPDGAVVLFDGSDTSKWQRKDGSPIGWDIKDGAMTVKTGLKDSKGRRIGTSAYSKDKFEHCLIHLEFKLPAMYEALGQARANSGVILNDGMYEVQILDSFGTPAFWNECGSIYRQVPPQVNASLEPEAWQTYDIEYIPAKFDGDKLVDYPRMTVYLNGKLVQNRTAIKWPTNKGPRTGNAGHFKDFARGPVEIQLQDHTNPVSFRNIWVLPIKK